MQIRIPEPVPDGLTIIETMRGEADGRIRLWPLHLDRLRRDCVAVGFALDETRLAAVMGDLPKGAVHRLRLTVDATGQPDLTSHPLPDNPPEWRVALSSLRLRQDDPWLRIKSSHRPVYDAARARMPKGADEVLLLNDQDVPCEGSITNLFLRCDGRLLTPPLSAGLLPGVLRRHLIDSGQAVEARITLDDIRAGGLLMGNALRGLIPARLI